MSRPSKRLIMLAMVVVLTLQACGSTAGLGPSPTPFGVYPLSSIFRDLYTKLGGESMLGPAVSPEFPHGEETCQYTEMVLMCFNPQAKVDADRLYLVPIGPVVVEPVPGETPKIYEAFAQAYHDLFGARYVGNPLSGVRMNADKRRIEQYFEKMGLYLQIDDPQHVVHLLAYGSVVCQKYCAYRPDTTSNIPAWNKGVEVPSLPSLIRIGGFDVVGNPVSVPYTAADQNLEQVFEKMLVYIPAENPSTIRLRPLGVLLKMPRTAPGPQVYGEKDGMVFYPVQGNLGYHVPLVFDQFITRHGGTELSGKPISDPLGLTLNGQQGARQCFENYCLEYDSTRSQPIYLSDLGTQYLQEKVKEENRVFEFSPQTTRLLVSEEQPQISSQEQAVIQVKVYQVKGMLPIKDIESVLILGLPDGKKLALNVPATNQEGTALVTLPAITDAPNGTVIPYAVCLNVPAREQICQSESFLIWNTQ
jgi:hypothetical protein